MTKKMTAEERRKIRQRSHFGGTARKNPGASPERFKGKDKKNADD